jgi:hypothetical protein
MYSCRPDAVVVCELLPQEAVQLLTPKEAQMCPSVILGAGEMKVPGKISEAISQSAAYCAWMVLRNHAAIHQLAFSILTRSDGDPKLARLHSLLKSAKAMPPNLICLAISGDLLQFVDSDGSRPPP